MEIHEDYSLLSKNTFGIDCTADVYIEYSSADEVREIVEHYRGRRLFPIGAGSNLLFLTPRFHGVVLHSSHVGAEVIADEGDTQLVRAGAGWTWDDFVLVTLQHELYGLENLSYIPGTVGASAVQNVGAFGAEAGEFIEEVEAVSLRSGASRIFRHDELAYAYRDSFFKRREEQQQWAIISVTYRLSKTFTPRLTYGGVVREVERRGLKADDLTAMQLRDLIIDIRRSKLPDPCETGSAGSFFKNPVVSADQFAELKSRFPDIVSFPAPGGVKLSAGWLIDQCGWKGRDIGRAGVYEKQALVIVNRGGATGQDVLRVCRAVQNDVRQRFGIELSPEVNFIE